MERHILACVAIAGLSLVQGACSGASPTSPTAPFSQTFTGLANRGRGPLHSVTIPRAGTATVSVRWSNVGESLNVEVTPARGGASLGTSPTCPGFCSSSTLTVPVQATAYDLIVIGGLVTTFGGTPYTLSVTVN